MTSKMIKVVGTSSTKDEEIRALQKMAECAGDGSYLASLFTPEFVGWIESQIRLGLPPNMWYTWQCEVKRAYDGQATLRDEANLLDKAIRVHEAAARQMEKQSEREARNRELETKDLRAEIAAMIEEKNRRGERINTLGQLLNERTDRMQTAEREVAHLKVECYDLYRRLRDFLRDLGTDGEVQDG